MVFFGFPEGWKGTGFAIAETNDVDRMWIEGSTVEVAWCMTANHGGKYQYRLGPMKDKSVNFASEVSAECFQQTSLEIAGDKQWLQLDHSMDATNRTEI